MAGPNAMDAGDISGISGNTDDDSLFVSPSDRIRGPGGNTMKRSADKLVEAETGPEPYDDDSNGDSHRDKRRRDSDHEEPDGRVHMDLMTERTAGWNGDDSSIHDPELYDQFKRAQEAGIYIGPGANIVVKHRSAGPEEVERDSEEAQRRASSGLQDEGHASMAQDGGNASRASMIQVRSGTEVIEISSENNPVAEVREQPPQGTAQETAQGNPVNITSDPPAVVEHTRPGLRIADILNPPEATKPGPGGKGSIRPRQYARPSTSYASWHSREKKKEERGRFKSITRRTLLHAFPPHVNPTRRMRTWCGWRLERNDPAFDTLADKLSPHPQLTRPYRRNVSLFVRPPTAEPEETLSPSERIKQEAASTLHSIQEDAGHDSGEEGEQPQATASGTRTRTARKAAIAGRQKMRDSQPPPTTRVTRGEAAKKSVALPRQDEETQGNDASNGGSKKSAKPSKASKQKAAAKPKTAAKKAPSKKPAASKANAKSKGKGKGTATAKGKSEKGG